MAEPNPQIHDRLEHDAATAPLSQDYYSVLHKVIEAVTHDPAQLRRLVYAMAWHNLRPDVLLSRPLPNEIGQARTILELERALEFKRAVERVEAELARRAKTNQSSELAMERSPAFAQVDANAAQPPQGHISPPPSSAASWKPQTEDSNPFRDGWNSTADDVIPINASAKSFAEEDATRHRSLVESAEAPSETTRRDAEMSPRPPSRDSAVIILPEQPPVWLQRTDRTILDRLPLWQDRPIRVAVEMVGYAPAQSWRKAGLLSFLQLVAAAVVAVALYVGTAEWLQQRRQPASGAVQGAAPAPAAATTIVSKAPADSGEVRPLPPPARPAQPEQPSALPFPLPKTYGVYAGGNGQLTELEPLPIRIPDARILLSAEIRKPSETIVAGGKLAFVVFRRDLLHSAPRTVSVRVVARVTRAMRFVNDKPVVTPIEGAWRIRNKGYELRVSPVDGQREMIIIQPDPDFVFPAGRYALVLNGVGYDFTVPGPVTSPEQCLELAEMLNGTVLSECAKS
jgi:hypothetical protein